MLKWLLRKRPESVQAGLVYAKIVKQARDPVFYLEGGIPDTYDGRFNLLAFHTALMTYYLGKGSEFEQKVSQEIFDTMFRDFQEAFRQESIGDTGVAKRVKTMAKAFYGRAESLRGIFEGDGVFSAYASRNMFVPKPDEEIADVPDRTLENMSEYMASAKKWAADLLPAAIAAADFEFPDFDTP